VDTTNLDRRLLCVDILRITTFGRSPVLPYCFEACGTPRKYRRELKRIIYVFVFPTVRHVPNFFKYGVSSAIPIILSIVKFTMKAQLTLLRYLSNELIFFNYTC